MELLLLRHALPEIVRDAERADPPLTEEGHAQARRLAKAVADGLYGPVTAVVTSTMLRARQTAEPLTEALGVVAETDERLVEFDAGWRTYGLGLDAYGTRQEAFRSMNEGRWGDDTYDPAAFHRRVVAGVEDAVARHPEGGLAVVCHGGVISAYLAHVLGTSQMLFFAPEHASVSRVHLGPDGYRELVSASEALHLRLP